MPSRRSFFKTLPFFAFAAPSITFPIPHKLPHRTEAEHYATLLATNMRDRYGGKWEIMFDSKNEFVLIRKVRC